ncbi:MAG TPA: DNA gyrase inhibitor YacG [Allosphingosinicella sp.]|jgi:hypothetical protein|uniref:DNA gyrase inhibitor YacG n=1 Tax=Allosphingosinicella sp. TaxID=2823234 RepID=UPI002F27C850
MSTAARSEARRRGACPLCGKPAEAAHRPFCSQGCRDRDLLNWLGDAYAVPGPPAEDLGADFPDGDGLDRG